MFVRDQSRPELVISSLIVGEEPFSVIFPSALTFIGSARTRSRVLPSRSEMA